MSLSISGSEILAPPNCDSSFAAEILVLVNDAGIPMLTLDILCLDSASQCATAVDIAWKRELVLGIPPK